MTGGCTYPIYYQGAVSLEKGSVIIRYKLPELIKKASQGGAPLSRVAKEFLRRGTPRSRRHLSSMAMVGIRTLLSHSHVLSMTSGCSWSIYHWGVVSVEKGSVIIRYKSPELIKKVSYGGNPAAALPQPCLKHDRRMFLSNILP